MIEQTKHGQTYQYLTAILVGGVVGAGLTMLLAPRTAREIRDRAARGAHTFGDAISERYRDARVRVTDAVDGLTRTGQGLRDGVYDSVARGAHEVEVGAQDVQKFASDAKSHKSA